MRRIFTAKELVRICVIRVIRAEKNTVLIFDEERACRLRGFPQLAEARRRVDI